MIRNAFDIPLGELREWRAGEQLSSAKLNGPVRVLNRMLRGADGPGQTVPLSVIPPVYKAVADESGGTIHVRRVLDETGAVTGPTETWYVLP